MKRTLPLLAAVLWLALLWPALASPAAAQFVGGVDDLPLMPGLTAVPSGGVVFETPQGRIVEALATLDAGTTVSEVRAFYDATLPQLGWRVVGTGEYRREGEVLVLEFDAGPPLAVRFRLTPAS